MPARRLRRFVLLVLLGVLVAKVIDVLRGDPAPAFSSHPSVDGGPRPAPASQPHLGPAPSTPVTDAGGEGPYPLTDPGPTWVDPVDGACPAGFPVKAKLRSGIYHLPGMAAYDRTAPDRCYPTPEAAAADGLRAAKR